MAKVRVEFKDTSAWVRTPDGGYPLDQWIDTDGGEAFARYFPYGEYAIVEIDTETGEVRVVPTNGE